MLGQLPRLFKERLLGTVKAEVITANVLNGIMVINNVCTGGRVLIRVGE